MQYQLIFYSNLENRMIRSWSFLILQFMSRSIIQFADSGYHTLSILSMNKNLLNISFFQVRSPRKETRSRTSNEVYVICTMTWSNWISWFTRTVTSRILCNRTICLWRTTLLPHLRWEMRIMCLYLYFDFTLWNWYLDILTVEKYVILEKV